MRPHGPHVRKSSPLPHAPCPVRSRTDPSFAPFHVHAKPPARTDVDAPRLRSTAFYPLCRASRYAILLVSHAASYPYRHRNKALRWEAEDMKGER